MSLPISSCPPSLKHIQNYLKTAEEHDQRDIVVAYWCRLYALEMGFKGDTSSPETVKFLEHLMDWVEKTRSQELNSAMFYNAAAKTYLENYALKLFLWADSQDRAANFNKNVVKAFYTAGMIYDILDTFGEPTEEVQQHKKYAKWKAAYIHKCLKNRETPIPGPMAVDGEDFDVPSSSNTQPHSAGFNISTPVYPTSPGFAMPSSGGNGMSSTTTGLPPEPHESKAGPDSAPEPLSPSEVLEFTNPDTVTIKSSPEPHKSKAEPDPTPEPLSPSKVLDFTNPGTVTVKPSRSDTELSPEQITQAQKYCKWAASALNYDDVRTAIVNLQKALQLLTTGTDD